MNGTYYYWFTKAGVVRVDADGKYNLMASKLDAAKADMARELNRSLFSYEAGAPVVPLTWRQRMSAKVARVRHYVATVWMALKGEDPYDYE